MTRNFKLEPSYFLQGRSDLGVLLELEKLLAGPRVGAGMVSLVTSLTQTVEDRMVTQEPISSMAELGSCTEEKMFIQHSHLVTWRESHLEADDITEKFPGGVADHGDSGDDSVLAEETAKDHVPLPNIGQIPGIVR